MRQSFNIIRKEDQDMDMHVSRKINVKYVIEYEGTSGLVPTLLVFGSLPRIGIPTDKPTTLNQKNCYRTAKRNDNYVSELCLKGR